MDDIDKNDNLLKVSQEYENIFLVNLFHKYFLNLYLKKTIILFEKKDIFEYKNLLFFL